MNWYMGNLPGYLPILRKRRQGNFSKEYSIEVWSYQSLLKDFGNSVKSWVPEAVQQGRQLAMHGFIPGKKIDRIYLNQRDLWHKAWREIVPYIKFSFCLEFDAWFGMPLLEGRKLQYRTRELASDMMEAGIPLIWLLLELKEGGKEDLEYYSSYANDRNMRWVSHNITGARHKSVFFEQLQVYAQYHELLNKDIGIVINGVGSESRIRAIKRVFTGREVVICNSSKIEVKRRGFV